MNSFARSLLRFRQRAGGKALEAMFKTLSRLGRLHPQARLARHGVEVVADVAYAADGSAAHRLDVYRPKHSVGPRPVVMYIHGGAFQILSKETHWLMALAFASKGYTVFNVNYRLAPKHRFPGGLQDVLAAYVWILDHAAQYGGDPARVVVAGESAGANLCLSLTLATVIRRPEPWAAACFERARVPDACIPNCGIYQVSDTDRFSHGEHAQSAFIRDRMQTVTRGYLGKDGQTPRQASELADPLLILEAAPSLARAFPPTFAAVGGDDPLLEDTKRLQTALERMGAPIAAQYYPGEGHAFLAFAWREQCQRYWADMFAFLEGVWANVEASPQDRSRQRKV